MFLSGLEHTRVLFFLFFLLRTPQAMSGNRKAAPATAATSGHSTEPAAPKGLQKDVVRAFVSRLQMPDRMGPDWLNDEERQEWMDYLEGEPDSVDEVAAADWPLPIRMPAKCRPRSAAGACSTDTYT